MKISKVCLTCLLLGLLFLSPSISREQDVSVKAGMVYIIPEGGEKEIWLLSSNSFVSWMRYPAEHDNQRWLRMTGATAYTRDVTVGGQTYISGATDGDNWHVVATRPDGQTITWDYIRFYSSYNGNENCFVSPYWYICGYTSIYIIWYTNSQCVEDGQWTMTFYHNDNSFYAGNFTVLPQVPPDTVPSYNQGAYSDAYNTICRTGTQSNVYHCDGRENEVPWTIAGKGCVITSCCMVLGYHGVDVTPNELNTWLINNGGYDHLGNVYWDAVAQYARQVAGVNITFLGLGGILPDAVCRYGPQVIKLQNRSHWVCAKGQNSTKTAYLINDPNGGVETTITNFSQLRRYSGPEYTYTDITGIVIRFHSPGELVITDPQGRRTGYNPVTGQSFDEIPGAGYEYISLEDAETGISGPESIDLDIRQPLAGDYLLEVIGTDVGTYILEITAYDPELNSSHNDFTDIPITPGAIHKYAFDYPKRVGEIIEPGGGFDGGGQRPKDVNKFLTYGAPTESQVRLPAGLTSYSIMVFYGNTTLPSSFAAELNGTDVTSLFNPTPGGIDIVEIPLVSGRNVVKLSIDGMLPNRTARDTDRLVFIVQ